MIKLITNDKTEHETDLPFQSIQALIKNGNLLQLTNGEYINPSTIVKIIAPTQSPRVNFQSNNFHVPTDEENKLAQEKMQPMKKMFDERKQFDKEMADKQRQAINSQSIYGAINPNSLPIEKGVIGETTSSPTLSTAIPAEMNTPNLTEQNIKNAQIAQTLLRKRGRPPKAGV